MPKVSVYLPDDLYARARAAGVSLSALTQDALERLLAARSVDEWLAEQDQRPSRRVQRTVTTTALMESVDDEFGS